MLIYLFKRLLALAAVFIINVNVAYSDNEYKVELLNENNGFVSSIIFSIVQDNEGFLWFGTAYDGVMRYDAHTDTHNHIYCTNTSEIIDFEDPDLNKLIKKFLKSKNIENFNIKDFSLHIEGEKIDKRKHIIIN